MVVFFQYYGQCFAKTMHFADHIAYIVLYKGYVIKESAHAIKKSI